MIKYLYIPADEAKQVEERRLDGLQMLQEVIGGHIEYVSLGLQCAYCNEEGKLLGLPVNRRATRLAFGYLMGDQLCGDVLVFSPGGENGSDVMDGTIDYVNAMVPLP